MAKAASTQQCLQFPAVSARGLLAILRSLAEAGFETLSQSELVVAKASDATWRVFLPVQPAKMTGGEAGVVAFRDSVKIAYKTAGNIEVGREAEQGFAVNLVGMMQPLEAAIILALQVDETGDVTLPRHEKMIVLLGRDDDVAAAFADITRQGRDVRTSGLHRLEAGKVGSFLVLTDDAEDYGSVSTYLNREDMAATAFIMTSHDLGFGRLWLEQSVLVADGDGRKDLTLILAAARKAKVLPPDVADIVVLLKPESGADIFYHPIETVQDAPSAVEAIGSTLEPVQPFDVTTVKMRPDKEASEALADAIHKLRRRVGYQVALQPLRRGIAQGVDVEPLRETISDLQMQIAQITALGAPQRRLMRFTDAQLPAMIDGLRRLPPQKLRDGSLNYAASHSAGRAAPAHFLTYDPQITFMHVAEARWRAETDSHPMSYWLEPFVAEAQLRRPTRTQVFVPSGNFMVPSLAHFGGDVDDSLRLVLGNLFDGSQELLREKKRTPYYLFTPSPAEGFRLEVEVLDGDDFKPLHQQLEWINDYLQVRSPVAVDADRLAEVASGLYEGAVAKALQVDLDVDIKAVEDTWAAAQARVESEALGAINIVSKEMDAVSSRIVDLHSYLSQAGAEMKALERTAAAATAALKGFDRVVDAMSDKDAALTKARADFEGRVEAELVLAEKLVATTQARVSELHERLRRIEDWGSR